MRRFFCFLTAILVACSGLALADSWVCPVCGQTNDGNFCSNDAQPSPAPGNAVVSGTVYSTQDELLSAQAKIVSVTCEDTAFTVLFDRAPGRDGAELRFAYYDANNEMQFVRQDLTGSALSYTLELPEGWQKTDYLSL